MSKRLYVEIRAHCNSRETDNGVNGDSLVGEDWQSAPRMHNLAGCLIWTVLGLCRWMYAVHLSIM